jgi:dihydrolipoamide dehydrogenase
MQQFDLVIIGGGPAGYTGAIRAAQLGMKVACIDRRRTLGGTCLNVGCIPSKALLNFSEKYEEAKHHFSDIGINTNASLDLSKMITKKNQVVGDLCKGIDGLFAKNKVTKLVGSASFISSTIIEINNESGKEQITAKNILIATGSDIIKIPGVDINETSIISSTGALNLQQVPETLIVIGGGYIGLELGSVWRRLGSKITVVEYADRIVPALDDEIGKQFTTILQKQGFSFKLNTKVVSAEQKANKVILTTQEVTGSKQEQLTADVVLVAVGRKAYTEDLKLESVGIAADERGRIEVNSHFQTAVKNIYAVGDVIKGPMLAHKAEEEAIAAVEIMAGFAGHVNYKIIPSVVYTSPEVASVGLNETELKAAGINYNIGKFPFLANSRARTMCATDGLVKILADSKTDQILGAHIIGRDAGTLIAEIAAVMEFGGAAEDVARTCHAHPTLSEAVREAALAVAKRAINF